MEQINKDLARAKKYIENGGDSTPYWEDVKTDLLKAKEELQKKINERNERYKSFQEKMEKR